MTQASVASERPLTARQREFLRLIVAGVLRGRVPTFEELAAAMGTNTRNGMYAHVRALTKRGLITADGMTARGITPVGARLTLTYDDTDEGRRLRSAVEGSGS